MMDRNEKRKTGFIIGGGEFTDRGIRDPHDLLVAADRGLLPLKDLGILPDVIVGDFDSLGYVPQQEPRIQKGQDSAEVQAAGSGRAEADYAGGGPELVVLPCVKDDTDMAAACRIAWEKGCRNLRLYGGSGSRPDHFLANLQLLAFYSTQGGEVSLVAPAFTVYALSGDVPQHERGSSLTLSGEPGTTFSVFSHSDTSEGVSITGDVKYAAENVVLRNNLALGVSNELTGKTAKISVKKGTLLVFVYISPDAAD